MLQLPFQNDSVNVKEKASEKNQTDYKSHVDWFTLTCQLDCREHVALIRENCQITECAKRKRLRGRKNTLKIARIFVDNIAKYYMTNCARSQIALTRQ